MFSVDVDATKAIKRKNRWFVEYKVLKGRRKEEERIRKKKSPRGLEERSEIHRYAAACATVAFGRRQKSKEWEWMRSVRSTRYSPYSVVVRAEVDSPVEELKPHSQGRPASPPLGPPQVAAAQYHNGRCGLRTSHASMDLLRSHHPHAANQNTIINNANNGIAPTTITKVRRISWTCQHFNHGFSHCTTIYSVPYIIALHIQYQRVRIIEAQARTRKIQAPLLLLTTLIQS